MAWVARKMGVSRQLVYLVLRGKLPPSRRFIDAAVRVLGVPEAQLFSVAPDVTTMTDSLPEHNPGHDEDSRDFPDLPHLMSA